MSIIHFTKMVGAGNDFIMIDNRDQQLKLTPELIRILCRKKYGIGADGVIALSLSSEHDFAMSIFNEDGSEAEMCGNGARCIMEFAKSLGIIKNAATFNTQAGVIKGEFCSEGVYVQLSEPHSLKMDIHLNIDDGRNVVVHSINTGVPHCVLFVDYFENYDVNGTGRYLRYHDQFKPKGTNVNFVQVQKNNQIIVRTYERGVEGETEACGTGSTASSIIAALAGHVTPPVIVHTRGGELIVNFEIHGQKVTNVSLTGPVKTVYTGAYQTDQRSL